MRAFVFALVAIIALPVTANAQAAYKGTDAVKFLFPGAGPTVLVNPKAGLSDKDRKTVDILIKTNGFKYYGAIAFSPDEGLISKSLQGAFNYHDVNIAAAAAVAECNKAKDRASRPCIIAAQIVPQGFRQRAFQLSQDATNAMTEYAKIAVARAMAVSRSSGNFAIAQGPTAMNAAIAACNRTAPRRDCAIAVRD